MESSGPSVTEKASQTMSNVRDQIATYGSQIQDYLNNINANFETYKFNVEKIDNGLSIEIALKATIGGNTKE